MIDALFVYGTLMAEESQAHLLLGLPRRAARVRGTLWDLPAGYPALTLDGEGEVHGELVEGVTGRHLALLDAYEGIGEGLYERVEVPVDWGLRRHPAWAYVMRSPREHGGRPVPSGRWRRTRRR